MKWGWRYGPDYVDKLRAMVGRHLRRPHRFVCLTDDASGIDPAIDCRPLPALALQPAWERSPWRKLSCLSAELADLDGPVLFLDLDLVVVDALDPFFDWPGRFCIIENWTQRGRGIGNSSVFRFEAGAHADLLDHFRAHAAEIVGRFANEQSYLSHHVAPLTYWPEAWCRSFKHHCLPGRLRRWWQPAELPAGGPDHRLSRPAQAARCGPRGVARALQGAAPDALDRTALAVTPGRPRPALRALPSARAIAMFRGHRRFGDLASPLFPWMLV